MAKSRVGRVSRALGEGIVAEIKKNDIETRQTAAYIFFRDTLGHRLTEDNEELLFDVLDACEQFGVNEIGEAISVLSRDRRK